MQTLLRDHVTLTCRSVDRMFLQAFVPQLQTPGTATRRASTTTASVNRGYSPLTEQKRCHMWRAGLSLVGVEE
jgi:hypothetical protein